MQLGDRFRILHEGHNEISDGVFEAAIYDRGLTRIHRDSWQTTASDLGALGAPLFLETSEGHSGGVWELAGALVRVTVGTGWIHVQVAAPDGEATSAALTLVRASFPLPDPSSSHDVPVTFWTYTPHGPMPSGRSIAVPEWDEISGNYAASTRRQLESVMRGFQPAHGGQLVLWHGAAGTGKTFALRALAWEWRDWCQLHYIVDPDSFFGQHADYLMSVLMQPGMPMLALGGGMVGRAHQFVRAGIELSVENDGEDAEPPWRLLILEDTGELLTPDAKSVIGQGLSRFLNVVDGLIGQGLRVLVLVTTNETIRSLHPAVARPGRAAANIEFAALSQDEAADWLRARGSEARAAGSRTLASLYAELEGRDPSEPAAAVGFGDVR